MAVAYPVVATVLERVGEATVFVGRHNGMARRGEPVVELISWHMLSTGIRCDVCSRGSFTGRRYKCLVCDNYDQCGPCRDAKSTSHGHFATHAMQSILTSSALAVYYQGEATKGNHAISFVCPYCNVGGFEEAELLPHLESNHGEPCRFAVWCPICVTVDGRDTIAMTDDLLEHVVHEHKSSSAASPHRSVRNPASSFRPYPVQRMPGASRPHGVAQRVTLFGSWTSSANEPPRPAAPEPLIDIEAMPLLEPPVPSTMGAVPELLSHRRLITTTPTSSYTIVNSSTLREPIPSLLVSPRSNTPPTPPPTNLSWRDRLVRNLNDMESITSANRGWSNDSNAENTGPGTSTLNSRLRSTWMDNLRGLDIQNSPPAPKSTVTFAPVQNPAPAKDDKKKVADAKERRSLISEILNGKAEEICTKSKPMADERLFMQEIMLTTLRDNFLDEVIDELVEPISYDVTELPEVRCDVSLGSSNMSISEDSDPESAITAEASAVSTKTDSSSRPAVNRSLSDTFLFPW